MRPRAVLGRQSGRHIRSAPWQSGPISRHADWNTASTGRLKAPVANCVCRYQSYSVGSNCTGRFLFRGDEHAHVAISASAAIPRPVNAKYLGKSIRGGQRDARVYLNRMLTERDLGQNICSSRQTHGQYLDHWLDIRARPRLRAKSFRGYLTLLTQQFRPRKGAKFSVDHSFTSPSASDRMAASPCWLCSLSTVSAAFGGFCGRSDFYGGNWIDEDCNRAHCSAGLVHGDTCLWR